MSTISDFYLARADEDARTAHATGLDNVRDRHLRSEATWRAMAERTVRGEEMRDATAAVKLADKAAAAGETAQ